MKITELIKELQKIKKEHGDTSIIIGPALVPAPLHSVHAIKGFGKKNEIMAQLRIEPY